jgi:release factor glutamine methyltransferase
MDQQLLKDVAEQLWLAGIGSWELEATLLADHVNEHFAEPGRRAALQALVERRCRREPLEHLVGKVRFRSLDLLHELGTAGVTHPLCVDLCTGSGTIALSLSAEVPQAVVHAVELDPGALAWAERNAKHHGLAVTLHQGDVAHALPDLNRCLDLVASNPPYVATGEMDQVRPEVRNHDPAVALGAGSDGLDVIRAVESAARRLLRPGGLLVVEHSDRQARSAPAVFADTACWADVRDHRDHDGLDRFVTAIRR